MKLKGRIFDNVDMIQAESKATLRKPQKVILSPASTIGKKDGTDGSHIEHWTYLGDEKMVASSKLFLGRSSSLLGDEKGLSVLLAVVSSS
ncbi:hypothetical protein LAZ67_11001325 [Cordylochernes scorpioides]|uniref:Uncharacterized protein n=1 Tax=Cordylochernes scorpioides TaxID=51811 RepID=A0ABY6L282_9ARAC|nr:hypothetical protein LAZ67_11001325 [Cordylochernes scorpioides]